MKMMAITFSGSFIDSYSWLTVLAGFCIVLASFALLVWVFTRLHTIQDFLERRKRKKEGVHPAETPVKSTLTGEENAAIATALFLYFSEMHDEEQYVMTIRKVSRTYSPWSSKIYGIWNSVKR